MSAARSHAIQSAGGFDYRWKGVAVLQLGKPLAGSFEAMMQALHKGFAVGALRSFITAYGLNEKDIETALGMSHSTLMRRKKSGRFNEFESDRLLRVAGLYALAEEVFGDRGLAVDWMQEPNRGLGGKRPIDYADTEAGAREVENLLGRIVHGIAA